MRAHCRPAHGVAVGLPVAEADVLLGAEAEDPRILRHQGDAPAHLRRIGLAQVDAVDADAAMEAGS